MAEYPAMPFWTDAYLGDTGHLTTIEHGCYFLLLITMWRAGGNLPNDDRLLARYARLGPRQWKRMKPVILPFFRVEGDTIFQPRLRDELIAVRQRSKRQRNNARAKYRKSLDTDSAMGVPNSSQNDASISITIKNPPPDPNGSAPPRGDGQKKGTRIPDDFEPDDKLISFATIECGLTESEVRWHTNKFIDYWRAATGQKGVKRDWPATWRNWMRTESERKPNVQNARSDPKPGGVHDIARRDLARHGKKTTVN